MVVLDSTNRRAITCRMLDSGTRRLAIGDPWPAMDSIGVMAVDEAGATGCAIGAAATAGTLMAGGTLAAVSAPAANAASTSRLMMRPEGPVPTIVDNGIPAASAIRRATGLIRMPPPDEDAGGGTEPTALAAGAGVGSGSGAGAGAVAGAAAADAGLRFAGSSPFSASNAITVPTSTCWPGSTSMEAMVPSS